jgi:hypothetical protein
MRRRLHLFPRLGKQKFALTLASVTESWHWLMLALFGLRLIYFGKQWHVRRSSRNGRGSAKLR